MNRCSFSLCCFLVLSVMISAACHKSSSGSTHVEEFVNVYTITQYGWRIKDNSTIDSFSFAPDWVQGTSSTDKGGNPFGFSAYSYQSSPDEYVYVYSPFRDSNYSVSCWLLSPVYTVKNGDKMSFYTRDDNGGPYTDHLQVLMNGSESIDVGNDFNAVGTFTKVLFDINPNETVAGYPADWTKYEYTFSGLSGNVDTRIAFRYFVHSTIQASGVGLDVFSVTNY